MSDSKNLNPIAFKTFPLFFRLEPYIFYLFYKAHSESSLIQVLKYKRLLTSKYFKTSFYFSQTICPDKLKVINSVNKLNGKNILVSTFGNDLMKQPQTQKEKRKKNGYSPFLSLPLFRRSFSLIFSLSLYNV